MFETVTSQVQEARAAQTAWAAQPLVARLAVIARARRLIAQHALELAAALGERSGRTLSETLMYEVVTLADACAFLERAAPQLLAPRRLGSRGRPLLFMGVDSEVHRVPLGVVLVIGPSNYPLYLPGVQGLQALAAGNACVLKPGLGGSASAQAFAKIMAQAGLDPRLLPVTDETAEAGQAALAAGVDKVILTGSAATGARVLESLASRLVPATMELSGCDAAFVLDGTALNGVVRALRWGLRLNAGATCIAPRRVFVEKPLALELEKRLAEATCTLPAVAVPEQVADRAIKMVSEARAAGARQLAPVGDICVSRTHGSVSFRPVLMADARPEMNLLRSDIFAPVMSLVTVSNTGEALEQYAKCPFALGASIFGPVDRARELALRVRAGSVSVNDLIAPTADPRVPFGGFGQSGFGVTRGAEGLLEMTALKTLSVHAGTFRPHYDDPREGDAQLFQTYLNAVHGPSWFGRAAHWVRLIRSMIKRGR